MDCCIEDFQGQWHNQNKAQKAHEEEERKKLKKKKDLWIKDLSYLPKTEFITKPIENNDLKENINDSDTTDDSSEEYNTEEDVQDSDTTDDLFEEDNTEEDVVQMNDLSNVENDFSDENNESAEDNIDTPTVSFEDLVNIGQNTEQQSQVDEEIITNQNYTVGEIKLDINNDGDIVNELYNNSKTDINIEPEKIESFSETNNKKPAIIISSVIVLLAVIISYFSLKKHNNVEEIVEPPVSENILEDTKPVDNIEESAEPVIQKSDIKELPQNVSPTNAFKFVEVKKVSWAIPEYLSYNDSFKIFLQSTARSTKLSLTSDLLLVTEPIYSNLIKVDVKISKNGDVISANIIGTSGSKQVDNIVLQTVKDTLNVVKPPVNVIVGDSINLTLKINL